MTGPASAFASPQPLPRISIVIPCLDAARHLEAAIESVLAQCYPDLELIIVDGGSTDGTVAIIEKYAARIAWWRSTADHGQSAAINAGLGRATGAIMTWLGADDVLLPNALARVGAYFAAHPDCAWLAGAGELDHVAEGRKGVLRSRLDPPHAIREFWNFGTDRCFIFQPSSFWSCDLWRRAGGLREDLHFAMDYDLWTRFAERATLHMIDDVLSSAIRAPGGKTHDRRREQLREVMRCGLEAAARAGVSRRAWLTRMAASIVASSARRAVWRVRRGALGDALRHLRRLVAVPLLMWTESGRLKLLG
jgi:glycosyltransferase involved in cell wall biosynthesis